MREPGVCEEMTAGFGRGRDHPARTRSSLALLVICVASLSCSDSTAPRENPCFDSLPIGVGTSVSGTIATTDCRLRDNTYADRYILTLPAATTIRIDLTSAQFDAFLLLASSQDEFIAENDDVESGNTDARIVRALAAGSYLIYANGRLATDLGSYQLSVSESAGQ